MSTSIEQEQAWGRFQNPPQACFISLFLVSLLQRASVHPAVLADTFPCSAVHQSVSLSPQFLLLGERLAQLLLSRCQLAVDVLQLHLHSV